MSKRLYDAGRSELALEAAGHDQAGREWDYLDARQRRYLDILARYFDVLLADMRFLRDDEVMTVAFLRWNKLRDVMELGRVSELDLLEKESIFSRELRNRTVALQQQQATRLRLALSLNRPDEPPAELERPDLPALERELGEVDLLLKEVLANNPRLKALRSRILAAGSQVGAAKAADGLVIRGEMELAAYNRTTGSSHPVSAGLVMELPLSSGGAADAALAKQRLCSTNVVRFWRRASWNFARRFLISGLRSALSRWSRMRSRRWGLIVNSIWTEAAPSMSMS